MVATFFGGVFIGFLLAAFLIMLYANYDPTKKYKPKHQANTEPTPVHEEVKISSDEHEMNIDDILAEYK